MKRLLSIIAAIICAETVLAQVPQKMSCQAVVRNTGGSLVTNQSVGMKISILQGSPAGSVVYTEIRTPATNANGLISIEIGGGEGFSSIDWANGHISSKLRLIQAVVQTIRLPESASY